MACHIFAASDGPAARRVGHGKTIEELSSIENGIWMCYTHGKLIDTDECTYTPALLNHWRDVSEKKAHLRQEFGNNVAFHDVSNISLADLDVNLRQNEMVFDINEAIEISCIADAWGQEAALTVRDLAIELARNALNHGLATDFKLTVSSHSIVLSDNGSAFSLNDLSSSSNGRGGASALRHLSSLSAGLLISYARKSNLNVVNISRLTTPEEIMHFSPCSISVDFGPASAKKAVKFIIDRPDCDIVFLVPSFGMLSYSDLYTLSNEIRKKNLHSREVILAMYGHSSGIYDFILKELPNVRVLPLRRNG